MSVIAPGAVIGIIGGGQLGRMFCMAARRMGYRTLVWTGGLEAPAMVVADEAIDLPFDSKQALADFVSRADIATAQAGVAASRASVADAQCNLDQTAMYAPADGYAINVQLRADVCRRLAWLGVQIDAAANAAAVGGEARAIHAADSAVEVWVVPTDEGSVAASDAAALLG